MKKILIALCAILLFTGCDCLCDDKYREVQDPQEGLWGGDEYLLVNGPVDEVLEEPMQLRIHIRHIILHGHHFSYIETQRTGGYEWLDGGWVHDPDCPACENHSSSPPLSSSYENLFGSSGFSW